MAHGGKREGAGRKSKAEEQKLIEKLSPLVPDAYKALKDALKDGEQWAVKLTFEYFYGKPKQTIEQSNTHEITNALDSIRELYGFKEVDK